jgi:hypothetical protein
MAYVVSGSGVPMLRLASILLVLSTSVAVAEYRITRDHGGFVEDYKARYARIRDSGERVVIDGVCNSACTLVLGIVPLSRICATPKASLGFHQAYYDKVWTFGLKITSDAGTEELLSYYPQPVRDWINRNGGLTPEMKRVENGPELWAMISPCPEEF